MPSGHPGSAQKLCPCGAPKSGTVFAHCKKCADEAKRSVGPCSVEGCERPSKTNGMCKNHDNRRRLASLPFVACVEDDCDRDRRHGTAGRCAMHSRRIRLHGAPDDAALSRRPNGAGGTRQEMRRSYENARRARKSGNFVENVDLATLWERDGGICHICKQPAERWNWHMDHVVPISRGGEHSYANTAVSHPGCNLRKGDR